MSRLTSEILKTLKAGLEVNFQAYPIGKSVTISTTVFESYDGVRLSNSFRGSDIVELDSVITDTEMVERRLSDTIAMGRWKLKRV